MSTDTVSWGGPYDDHACFLIVPYMPGGWGSGEMHVRISNGPGTAITPSALTIGHNAVVSNGDIGSLSDRRIKKEIKTSIWRSFFNDKTQLEDDSLVISVKVTEP